MSIANRVFGADAAFRSRNNYLLAEFFLLPCIFVFLAIAHNLFHVGGLTADREVGPDTVAGIVVIVVMIAFGMRDICRGQCDA